MNSKAFSVATLCSAVKALRFGGKYCTVFGVVETPFRLLIGFITILHVVTTVTYYTVTHLHSLQSVYSNIPILFGAFGIHLETVDRCLGCSSCLQDNPFARTPRKTVALLLRCVRTIS
jgi:hypothetical protein